MTTIEHEDMPKGMVRRICLTGGPCGGKTTVQVTLSDVFENMGWKVYRVTETATVLLNGGVVFSRLSPKQADDFQGNLLKTMLHLEATYMALAEEDAKAGHHAIVICDRGTMDPSAYMPRDEWLALLDKVNMNELLLRDQRYDCVINLMSAACGAEAYYGSQTNKVRSESLDLARHLDDLVAKAWIGHPYYDIIDNSTGFEEKKQRVIGTVLKRLGLEDNRYGKNIVKRKFLISGPLPEDSDYPVDFRDFTVQHEYLTSSNPDAQTRLRKRGIVGSPFFLFTLTQRKTGSATEDGQTIEIRRTIPLREYEMLLAQRDPLRDSITKKRRCFVWKSQYFQLDTYMNTEGPLKGLAILEAYVHQHPASIHAAACKSGSTPNEESCERSPSPVDSWMPPFVQIEREVTNDPHFSMFTLSLAQKHQ